MGAGRPTIDRGVAVRLDMAGTSLGKTPITIADPRIGHDSIIRPAQLRVVREPGPGHAVEPPGGYPRIEWLVPDTYVAPPPGRCLTEFIRLSDAEPERIGEFARRWGVLRICTHGLPSGHNALCTPMGTPDSWFWEPIDAWHAWTRRLRAVMELIARLRQDRRGTREMWEAAAMGVAPTLLVIRLGQPVASVPQAVRDEAVRRSLSPTPSDWWEEARSGTLEREQRLLDALVDRCIDLSGLRPTVRWGIPKPEARWSVNGSYLGLFQLLMIEVMAGLTGETGVWTCDGCGILYQPERQPRAGQNHYCQECRADGYRASKTESERRRRRVQREKLLAP